MNYDAKLETAYKKLGKILGGAQKHGLASDLEVARLYSQAQGQLLPIQVHQLQCYAVSAWDEEVTVTVDFNKKKVIYNSTTPPKAPVQDWVKWLLGHEWSCECQTKTKSRSRPRSRPGKRPRSGSGQD